jgi:hypothetical protein
MPVRWRFAWRELCTGAFKPADDGVCRRVCTSPSTDLSVNVGYMALNGVDAENEGLGNLTIGPAGSDETQHFDLSPGEAVGVGTTGTVYVSGGSETLAEKQGEVVVDFGILRPEAEGLAVVAFGARLVAAGVQEDSEVVMSLRVIWLQVERGEVVDLGLGQLAPALKEKGVVVVAGWRWLQANGMAVVTGGVIEATEVLQEDGIVVAKVR